MKSVLVIDDEAQIRRLLRFSMERQGYTVNEAATATAGLEMVVEKKPDIVLLDLGLPDRDGADALTELRTWSSVPVIVLSVRNDEEDIVRLLESGADDYLTKPFNTEELMVRIRVAIRRNSPKETGERFVSGRLAVDLLNREVNVEGQPVKLTPTEYGIIRVLTQHSGRVVTHGQLLREVWGPQMQEETNYLHVYIRGLRKKIERNPQFPELFLTEPGVDYRLVVLLPAIAT